MTQVSFYHLKASPLEKALPKLLEKIIEQGFHVLILTHSEEHAESLSTQLWTYHPGSFLPHGTKKDGFYKDQTIFLTSEEENVNESTILIVVDGRLPKTYRLFKKVLDIFDGSEEDFVLQARKRWTFYKNQGLETIYWSQQENGAWQKNSKD